MMRIGIDARCLISANTTGIPRYVTEIVRVWRESCGVHEYYLFSPKQICLPFSLPDNWHFVTGFRSVRSSLWWSVFDLPGLIREYNIDAFWNGNFTLPRRVSSTHYYVTVHDIALFRIRGIADWKTYFILRTTLKTSCKRADRIIAVSEATKTDLHDYAGIPYSKIIMSYEGGLPDKNKLNFPPNQLYQKRFSDKPFFLFLGTIEPRKNITTILRAFEQYIDATNADHQMIIAGGRGWKCQAFDALYEGNKYKDRILLAGYVSDEEKDYLLSNAIALLYPSLYEGFGIPVLEAFDYLLPVITSNVSSLPEVGGDAALYVNEPQNVNELVMQMTYVTKMTPEEKQELIRKMKMQRERFSWEKCAEEVMQVLEER